MTGAPWGGKCKIFRKMVCGLRQAQSSRAYPTIFVLFVAKTKSVLIGVNQCLTYFLPLRLNKIRVNLC